MPPVSIFIWYTRVEYSRQNCGTLKGGTCLPRDCKAMSRRAALNVAGDMARLTFDLLEIWKQRVDAIDLDESVFAHR